MQVLSADELGKFQVIAASAHREGWLNPDAQLVAERIDSSVRVSAVAGSDVVAKTYPRDERWLFQLVRDLAWGSYATRVLPPPG